MNLYRIEQKVLIQGTINHRKDQELQSTRTHPEEKRHRPPLQGLLKMGDSEHEGSHASAESRTAQATKAVRCKYLSQMEKIPHEVNETEHLLVREDLYAKLSAGVLVPLDNQDHVHRLAIECGWEADDHEDKAKAILSQQDRVIAAVLIVKLGRWRQMA